MLLISLLYIKSNYLLCGKLRFRHRASQFCWAIVGLVRFAVGVLVSARGVTKLMSEQCLCKEEGEPERQNACAVIRLSGVLAIMISRKCQDFMSSRSSMSYHFPKCYQGYSPKY